MEAIDLVHLETYLRRGLIDDARALSLEESTVRLLLALEPDRGLSMLEITSRLQRTPSTTTRFVDRGVREHQVARQRGAQDRRQRLVVLTPRGEANRNRLLDEHIKRARALAQAMQARTGLGQGQISWFLRSLLESLIESRAS